MSCVTVGPVYQFRHARLQDRLAATSTMLKGGTGRCLAQGSSTWPSGIVFVFGTTAALASVVTEMIARLLGLRGAYLLTGLRELLDDGGTVTDLSQAKADYHAVRDMVRGSPVAPSPASPPVMSATGALLGSPTLSNQGMTGQISSRKLTIVPAAAPGRLPRMTSPGWPISAWRQRRSLPSYIPARSFSEAVIDLVVPDTSGSTTMPVIQQGVAAMPPELGTLRSSLQTMITNAGDDVGQLRTEIEHWYDDHMDRVSGWYKRHVAKITLVVGAILILLLNINTLTIGRTLYTESTVSSAVSAVAAKGTDCSASQDRQACLDSLQAQLSAVAAAGLPVGWGTVRDCRAPRSRCNWLDQRGIFSQHGSSGWQLLLVLIGFLITVIAIVPGARFWFDLLGRLGSLRETGPKPAPPVG